MKKKKECPCKEEFLNETQKMVDTVEAYTEKERRERNRDIQEAFGTKK